MSWLSLASSDKNRKQKFLEEMDRVLPWGTLLAMCRKHYREESVGRPKTDLELLLRIYFLQQWYELSDPMAEAEIYDSIAFRSFLGLDILDNAPDESTICRFRHFLEQHRLPEKFFRRTTKLLQQRGVMLKRGTIVDASIVRASSSTKNRDRSRDPQMSSTRKNNNYYFGAKQHIGVDSDTGLIHSLVTTTAKESDIGQLDNLLHGDEQIICGDKAYSSQQRKRQMRAAGKIYLITDKATPRRQLSHKQRRRNRQKSSLRSKVEHPFMVIKHLWRQSKCRYRGLFKNNMQWNTLAMLHNFYKLRHNPEILNQVIF